MTNLQTLIDQTLTNAAEATKEGDYDLAQMYLEDRKEFMSIQYLLNAGYTEAANKAINKMDTMPREQIFEAIMKDQ